MHAYVSGTAIELMNPSDNVLRAGLTPKHIDAEELIKVLGERQDAPVVQRPAANGSGVEQYAMWDERMSVQHIRVLADNPVGYTFEGTSAALVVDGSVTISVGEQNITLRGTESVLHAGDSTSVTITGRANCISPGMCRIRPRNNGGFAQKVRFFPRILVIYPLLTIK